MDPTIKRAATAATAGTSFLEEAGVIQTGAFNLENSGSTLSGASGGVRPVTNGGSLPGIVTATVTTTADDEAPGRGPQRGRRPDGRER